MSHERVTPVCCEAAKTTQVVFLSYDGAYYCHPDYAHQKPVWMAMGQRRVDDVLTTGGCVRVGFCPHCAAPVPDVEPRKTRRRICRISDGGYYCDTCKKRLNCCECAPPEYAWKPVT